MLRLPRAEAAAAWSWLRALCHPLVVGERDCALVLPAEGKPTHPQYFIFCPFPSPLSASENRLPHLLHWVYSCPLLSLLLPFFLLGYWESHPTASSWLANPVEVSVFSHVNRS